MSFTGYTKTFVIGRQEQKDYYRTMVAQNWWKSVLTASVAGAVVAWFYLSWVGDEFSTLEKALTMVATSLLTALVSGGVLVMNTHRHVDKQIRRNGKESYEQLVEITGFGVRVVADGREGKLSFEKLHRVQETKKAFYIHVSNTHAWILPKEQMADMAAESRQLRELFGTVVESRRLKFLND